MKLRHLVVVVLIALLTTGFGKLGREFGLTRTKHGGGGGSGLAQLNLGSGDLTAQLFINVFNSAAVGFSSGATPAALDANLYPVNNFTGTITGQIGPVAGLFGTTGPWTMGWSAGRSCFRMIFQSAANITNVVNATIVNGSGSGNPSIAGNCANAGSVTINWVSAPSPLTYQWDGTYTQWASNTSGNVWLIRQSDQTAFTNGTYWTPEAVSLIGSLHPESIRPMGWNVQTGITSGSNVVNWNYRRTVSAFSYNTNGDFPPGTRCGGLTSFCTISVTNGALVAAAANDTSLAGWVDGEQLSGNIASTVNALSVTGVVACNSVSTPGCTNGNCQITVASTTGLTAGAPISIFAIGGSTECNQIGGAKTTIQTIDSATQFTIPVTFVHAYTSGGKVGYQTLAITGKSGGAKLIMNVLGLPIGTNFDTLTSGNSVFTYNSVLDVVLYSSSGINNAVPLEAQVQLANLVNANFWYTIPPWANNTFITNTANTAFSSLTTNQKFIVEYGNELWNFQFAPAQWATQMGAALGLTTNAPQPFQSLRVRQINGTLLPASSWSAAMSRLERTYGFQAGSGGTAFATGPMQGSSLVSPGNAAYQAYVGGSAVNYNTSPNRPIDFTDSICYAPYVGGGTALSGQSGDTSHTPTAVDTSLLTTIVSDWNASNTAGAIALIDQSVRGDYQAAVQTVTASGTTFTTPSAHGFVVNDVLRFTASGGTAYSGLNLNSLYQVLTVPLSTTFTVGQVVNGATGATVTAGSVGSGVTSVGYLGNGGSGGNYNAYTVFSAMSFYYAKYQNMTATGFSPVPAGGTPAVRWYEGALEPSAPTTAQCTTLSINSTDCTTIATALTGWKNDPSSAATIEYYYKTFTGAAAGTITSGVMPNSKSPSQLVLQGGGLYGLNSNFSFIAPAVYQLYNGFAAFSSGH